MYTLELENLSLDDLPSIVDGSALKLFIGSKKFLFNSQIKLD